MMKECLTIKLTIAFTFLFLLNVDIQAQNGDCVITTINYDFEEPQIDSSSGWPSMEDQDNVPGWQTTASDGVIEVWPSSNNGGSVTAYSGSQYIELNANEVSGVYQDYQTPIEGAEFNYSFAHAARNSAPSGSDIVGVYAGAPGGTLTLIDQYSTEVNTGWDLKTGTYIVPANQGVTRFEFRAISTATGQPTVGNFLDAIEFTANFGILSQNPLTISCTSSISVEALGDGQWIADDSSNPSPAVVTDPNSGSTTITGFDNVGTYTFAWTNQVCFDLLTVEVVQGSIPVNTIAASLPSVCDEDNDGLVFFNLTQAEDLFVDNPQEYQIEYYMTQSAADTEDSSGLIDSPENYSIQTGEITNVFLRINQGDCHEVVALNLSSYFIPKIRNTIDLNTCDNSTGVYVVDLTLNDTNIIGNQNPSTIDIGYYLSQVDAENDQNEITDSANFELSAMGCETIFVKVKNSNQEQCYQISSFEACAIDVLINSPQDLQSCTISDNGLAYFNLTSNNTTILDGQDPSLFDIKYFTSLDDATNNTNEISTPPNYLASNQTQTIFVRLENSQNSTCFDVDSFVIESEKVAVVEAEELTSCVNEDSSSFDLTAIESDLNLSQDRTLVGYYSSLEDAVEDSNKISNPQDFVNSSNVETVYAYVATSQQTCFEVYSIQLVSEVCEPFIPEGFSPNGDGINDVFEISGVLENFPNFRLEIFSRYGQKVYQGNTNKDYWNGTSEAGNDLPTGTYYYVLDLNDSTSEVIKGWVYLNR
ncbi:gliding motility-associated C-terminal domain-containing protein [Mesonia aquimarina]|uniref:gliding motility-associated C-terminal domain-containing protein n=1 Tax=Mesonia aquimarina TaxID=1504967 RepID=UPI0013CEE75C|nr:gliding motility-associated C-terminal domain-containing protein [Mesonia aquimarina]